MVCKLAFSVLLIYKYMLLRTFYRPKLRESPVVKIYSFASGKVHASSIIAYWKTKYGDYIMQLC